MRQHKLRDTEVLTWISATIAANSKHARAVRALWQGQARLRQYNDSYNGNDSNTNC